MKSRKDIVYSHLLSGFSYYSNGRSDMAIHASDFAKWCSRRFVLCENLGRPYHHKKFLGVGTELVFAIGEKIEEIIAEKIAGAHVRNIDVIRGISMVKKIDGYILTGSIDIGLVLKDSFIPIEVKSISPDQFLTLESPKPEHQKQLETYLYLLKSVNTIEGISQKTQRQIVIDTRTTWAYSSGVIIYVCKTYNQEPIKVFEIEFNKTFNKFIKSIVSELKIGRKGKLPSQVCTHQGSSMARQCPEVNFCFGEDK